MRSIDEAAAATKSGSVTLSVVASERAIADNCRRDSAWLQRTLTLGLTLASAGLTMSFRERKSLAEKREALPTLQSGTTRLLSIHPESNRSDSQEPDPEQQS